jgi:hypothetical protein
MTILQQIQQDIQTLSPEALNLVAQFIQGIKQSHPVPNPGNPAPQSATAVTEKTIYEKFQDSGLIGCVSIDENLSTTYKQVLAEEWSKKYDHH